MISTNAAAAVKNVRRTVNEFTACPSAVNSIKERPMVKYFTIGLITVCRRAAQRPQRSRNAELIYALDQA